MVGEEIRKLRTQRGITLNALAESVGLSPSAVSQIERGIVDPSLRSLRSIAQALDTPVFSFFLEAPRQSIVVRSNQRRSFSPTDHTATYELVTPDLNRRMEMIVMHLEAGTTSSEQPLAHAGDECLMVVEGSAEITVANERYFLEEGDSIYLNEGVPHVVANVGNSELVCIAAITPAVF